MTDHDIWEERLRKTVGWAAVVVAGLFAAGFFTMTLVGAYHGIWIGVALEHVPSIIGLPCAVAASVVLVLLLRTVAGNIEVKLLGLEFKGAAGPIIMWIFCFLAITVAIAKTWDLKSTVQPSSMSSPQRSSTLP
jgi:hypothetical protein